MTVTHAVEAIRQIVSAEVTVPISPAYPVVFRDIDGAVGRRDVATHWIHWYPAKMFHRIPQAILKSLSLPEGSVVLDPFCGSGTVLLEAGLLGYRAIGIDINPLARMISSTKTTLIEPALLLSCLGNVLTRAKKSRIAARRDKTLDFWFARPARAAIQRLLHAVNEIQGLDCRNFFLVTLSSVLRSLSLADPSIAPPVRLSYKRAARAGARYQRALEWTQAIDIPVVFAQFEEAARENIRRMVDLAALTILHKPAVLPAGCEAAKSGLPARSVDLIVTSPPYCGAQKYVRSLRLEMLTLGFDSEELALVDRRTLGTERITRNDTEDTEGWLETGHAEFDQLVRAISDRNITRATMLARYINYLRLFAAECGRVLRPGGDIFVTFGTSRIAGIEVRLDKVFAKISTEVGLRHVTTLVDKIPSRGMITRRHRTASRIDDECVVWLKG